MFLVMDICIVLFMFQIINLVWYLVNCSLPNYDACIIFDEMVVYCMQLFFFWNVYACV